VDTILSRESRKDTATGRDSSHQQQLKLKPTMGLRDYAEFGHPAPEKVKRGGCSSIASHSCLRQQMLAEGIERVGHMVSINEELDVAKAAKAAIKALLTATSKPAVLATLKKANRTAILNLSSGGALNEARGKVGIALSNIMHGLPTKEKIDEAKSAIDAWIKELEGSL
jgi:hypothetical protein